MPDLSKPSRILLVRPSALGDVCRTVPVLVSLKRAFPAARIDWLVQDNFAPAVAHHPDLDEIVPFSRVRFSSWHTPAVLAEFWSFLRSLRGRGYDMALDCQGLARSGLMAWATRAPMRLGFLNAGELGWVWLNRRVGAPRDFHTVDRMLLLARAAGAEVIPDMRLYTCEGDRAAVAGKFALPPGRYSVFAPTTRWPGKQWPGDRYVELARRFFDDHRFGVDRVVIVGAAPERDQCRELADAAGRDSRLVNLIGRTSVGELMALVEGSRMVVGSDSAAIHMAVGFSRPLVGLYGPTRVDLVGPYGRSMHVVQRLLPGDRLNHKDATAGRALMARIGVQHVFDCAVAQLARPKPAPATPAAVAR